MFKSTLILMILFSLMSHAKPSYPKIKKSNTLLMSELGLLEVERRNLEKIISDSQKEVAMQQAFVDNIQKKWKQSRAGNAPYSYDLVELGKANTKARNLLDELKRKTHPKVDSSRNKLTIISQRIDSLSIETNKIQDNKVKTEVNIDLLRTKIKEQSVTMGFNELNQELNNVDHTLDEIEQVYDKSRLGAYFQDKMGQLLNSQVICQIRRRCWSKGKDPIPAKDIQKELFPETKSRSEYWEKVNSSR